MDKTQWAGLIQSVAAGAPIPEGFTRSFKRENYFGSSYGSEEPPWVLRIEREDDIKIAIIFTEEPSEYQLASGHVSFKAPDGKWRTFDRHGVSDSFYLNSPLYKYAADGSVRDPLTEVSERIPKALAKVAESRAVLARSLPVPGLPQFTVTPEQRLEIGRILRAGNTHHFYPAGFGTGYILIPNHRGRKSRWGPKPASLETAEFFGVTGTLYIDTFDHD